MTATKKEPINSDVPSGQLEILRRVHDPTIPLRQNHNASEASSPSNSLLGLLGLPSISQSLYVVRSRARARCTPGKSGRTMHASSVRKSRPGELAQEEFAVQSNTEVYFLLHMASTHQLQQELPDSEGASKPRTRSP